MTSCTALIDASQAPRGALINFEDPANLYGNQPIPGWLS